MLRPGEKLKLVELATRYSVSQSVIREALTRLAEQSLVVATPQRGFRVRVLLLGSVDRLKGDAPLAAQRWNGPSEPAGADALKPEARK